MEVETNPSQSQTAHNQWETTVSIKEHAQLLCQLLTNTLSQNAMVQLFEL